MHLAGMRVDQLRKAPNDVAAVVPQHLLRRDPQLAPLLGIECATRFIGQLVEIRSLPVRLIVWRTMIEGLCDL